MEVAQKSLHKKGAVVQRPSFADEAEKNAETFANLVVCEIRKLPNKPPLGPLRGSPKGTDEDVVRESARKISILYFIFINYKQKGVNEYFLSLPLSETDPSTKQTTASPSDIQAHVVGHWMYCCANAGKYIEAVIMANLESDHSLLRELETMVEKGLKAIQGFAEHCLHLSTLN